MKRRSYGSRAQSLPVEWRQTVDIHTGEMSRMPVQAQYVQPDYGTVYLAAFVRISRDPRMTPLVWSVFGALIGHLTFEANWCDVTLAQLGRETGIARQHITKALSILRAVGALAPSQAFGKYHLSAHVIYRGKGVRRLAILAEQQRRVL